MHGDAPSCFGSSLRETGVAVGCLLYKASCHKATVSQADSGHCCCVPALAIASGIAADSELYCISPDWPSVVDSRTKRKGTYGR